MLRQFEERKKKKKKEKSKRAQERWNFVLNVELGQTRQLKKKEKEKEILELLEPVGLVRGVDNRVLLEWF